MTALSKRATVYFNPDLYKALKFKAADISIPISVLVNDAIRLMLLEDAEDLAAFSERKNEPVISFEQVLKDLKKRGKL